MTVSELQSILSTFPPETLVMMSGYNRMHQMSKPIIKECLRFEDGSFWKKGTGAVYTKDGKVVTHEIVQVVEISYWKGEL